MFLPCLVPCDTHLRCSSSICLRVHLEALNACPQKCGASTSAPKPAIEQLSAAMKFIIAIMLALVTPLQADSATCGVAFGVLISEYSCDRATEVCSTTCKPLRCAVVSSCIPGVPISVTDESGWSVTIAAADVNRFAHKLEAEQPSCPCTASKAKVWNLTKALHHSRVQKQLSTSLRGGRAKAPDASATACETAFFGLVGEDSCGDENGPDATKACSATCKPLACAVVSSCPPRIHHRIFR